VHVTGDDLRAYLEVFHQALAAAAKRYLPADHESILLRHASLLPARISAHVSSQFGVAIEYEPAAPPTSIQVHSGSDRVEDLLLRAPAWARELAPMYSIDGPNHTLRKRPLTRGFPFRLTSERASLTLEEVIVQLGPWKRTIHYAELYGSLDDSDWTVEKAHARARNEVLLGLLRLQQAKARQLPVGKYLEQYQDKMVLLLGDEDDAGQARLAALADTLREFHYEPVCLSDLPPQPEVDRTAAIMTLGAVARFAIVDGPQDAPARLDKCNEQGWLAVPLCARGTDDSWATDSLAAGGTVLPPGEYDAADPAGAILPTLRLVEAAREDLEGRMRG
jgi:hypothetical protein